MSYRFAAQPNGELIVVVFEGSVSPEEEQRAIMEVTATPGLSHNANVLVDRRRARMSVGPQHVRPQVDLVRKQFKTETRPRMALVAGQDYDFAMARMLELTGGDDLPHEFRVFRELGEACAWLGIDPEAIVWP